MLANSHMHLVHVWWSVVLSYHVGLGLGLNLCNQAWQQVLLPTDLWPNRSLFTPLMRGRYLTLGGEGSAKPQTRRPGSQRLSVPFWGTPPVTWRLPGGPHLNHFITSPYWQAGDQAVHPRGHSRIRTIAYNTHLMRDVGHSWRDCR